MEEYVQWQAYSDYPDILRQYSSEVVELSGLVLRMIVELVSIVNIYPDRNFDTIKI
jgi:hypothetical protein